MVLSLARVRPSVAISNCGTRVSGVALQEARRAAFCCWRLPLKAEVAMRLTAFDALAGTIGLARTSCTLTVSWIPACTKRQR